MQAIAEGLFTAEDEPRLLGGRDRRTGRIVFPCPPGGEFEPFALSRTGTLWSWTVQRYRPKTPPYAGPENFEPWTVGYVELRGETIVEARIVGVPPEQLMVGLPLELTQVPLDPQADTPRMIPAFQPVEMET